MIKIRKSKERGHFDFDWLDTYHTFSFGDYHDPEHMNFRQLRVINEDRVKGGEGFGTHPHRDMEIITYVIEGALEHKDSMGTGSVIRPGDVQLMSAGKGVTHSEFNNLPEQTVHLLQIWIMPSERGIKPSYQQKNFAENLRKNRLCLVVSPDAKNDSLKIHQNAAIYASRLQKNQNIVHELPSDRPFAWVQLIKGTLTLNGQTLKPGDGAALSDEKRLDLKAIEDAEFLLFELN